jgi:predicted ATPase
MAELDYITVKGFKSIASIEQLKPGPITVLIGPNGSGKSNFIGVFAFLNAIREGRLQEYVMKAGGADKILHFGSRVTDQLYVHISFQEGVNQYDISLQTNDADELFPSTETLYYWDKQRYPQPYVTSITRTRSEAGISRQAPSGIARYVRRHLDSWRLYHFHDTSDKSPMKSTADVNDNRYLRPDGSNLGAFLHLLRERYPESYRTITRAIGEVAPFFEDFVLEPLRLNPDNIRLEWKHSGTDAYFNTASLSDGTLRFMAVATLFLQPAEYRPSVILVDEPELGMHPYAITLLAALMRAASTESQVIVSTQSSLLLDHFDPEEVLVAERIDGATQFVRLESSRLGAWLESYSLGQLWEKNELGGRPRRE